MTPQRLALFACLLCLWPLTAAAQQQAPLPGRAQQLQAFDQVIDTRCTRCHTRERIDLARRQGRDLGEIQKRMLERGAVLTEEEQSILRVFWGNPRKP
jgi:cytochrome c553